MKIGFITCADLSRYFFSVQNPLLTHDDQLAFDYLAARGCKVDTVIWGSPVSELRKQNFDLLVVRSPWDYSENDEKQRRFLSWLETLEKNGVRVVNSVDILKWSLDKHYLYDLEQKGVRIVPTEFLEPTGSLHLVHAALKQWGEIVVKPCIAAAAKDAFLIRGEDELVPFIDKFVALRQDRSFMLQPFIREIENAGEWSLVFLNDQYSHAVLKKPKAGGWLVQDELGGSVDSLNPPSDLREFAEDAYAKLALFLQTRFGEKTSLLYARVDVLPGLRVGELELAEPELFFLDRRNNLANEAALQKFYGGIVKFCLPDSIHPS